MECDRLNVTDFFCDHHNCRLLNMFEVYPKNEDCWYYFCLCHFIKYRVWKEKGGEGWGWCLADWITHIPLITRIWNWWVKCL